MIRALVVDDEPHARRTLVTRLEGEEGFDVAAECASGREAIAAIRDLGPDLVFLDVRMPDLSGFDVLQALGRDELPAVVFVTAFDEYALRAFDVHALGYLLKPFDDIRFAETIAHVRSMLAGSTEDLRDRIERLLEEVRDREAGDDADGLERLVVRSGKRRHVVPAVEIDWIEAAGDYARLHCGERTHLVTRTMAELEARLDPGRFVRIHRSTIVNVDRVRELHSEDGRDWVVRLAGGERLRMSRTYREALERVLGDRL